jgi:hypothetical protein
VESKCSDPDGDVFWLKKPILIPSNREGWAFFIAQNHLTQSAKLTCRYLAAAHLRSGSLHLEYDFFHLTTHTLPMYRTLTLLLWLTTLAVPALAQTTTQPKPKPERPPRYELVYDLLWLTDKGTHPATSLMGRYHFRQKEKSGMALRLRLGGGIEKNICMEISECRKTAQTHE